MNLRETGWEGVDWIHLAEERDQWWAVVNTVMNLQIPQKVKLSLCLTKHNAMKTNWGSGGIAPRILDLGTRRR
jgi:hypothetical protein